MSQKITSKNLHYDTTLPPFLARMKGEQSSRTGPDPILASHRRPGQKRSASEEAEDAPLVVDEEGNIVDLPDQTDALKSETKEEHNEEEDKDTEKAGERVAGIGGAKKRKAGRVIGEETKSQEEKDKDAENQMAKASADVRRLMGETTEPSREKEREKPKKKKAKKIKLSFGDDGD
ncbi:hypothetical protein F5Y18DRAFT_91167 [Xylariaceae sp. FL1019]|nr:hypothetical protein F5Y18DRAFT_91167 [Xylariaceae sp. FL1019]